MFTSCLEDKGNNNNVRNNFSDDFPLFIDNFNSELNQFISKIDSMPRSRELQNIVRVYLYKKKKDTILLIQSHYYYTKPIDYFQVINGSYLVVYYNFKNYYPLILKPKSQQIPKKFKSKKEAFPKPFESTEVIYKYSGDSLVKQNNANGGELAPE